MITPGRRLGLLLWLFASTILSGCWDRIEVNDLAIVQGVALDLAPDGLIEVTTSIAVPARITPPGATGGGGQTGPPATNKSATGRTITEAFTRLQEKLSRRLFWAHNAVLLIGEDLAREGVGSALDFFTRNRQPRMNTTIAVTTGPAKDVLATTLPIELNVPIGIQEIERLRHAPFVDLLTFLRLLHSEGIEPTTGLVHVVTGGVTEPGFLQMPDDPASDPSQPGVFGAAIFKGDRLVALLSEQDARSLLLIRGELGFIYVTVPIGSDSWIGLSLVRYRNRIVPRNKDGRLVIELHLSLQANLQDNGAGLDADDFAVIEMIEEELRKTIERRIREALDKLQAELGVDAPGFGAAIKRRMPELWRELHANWDEIYPTIPVDIHVEASVLRTGMTNMPQAFINERVIGAERLREILRGEGTAE